MHDFIILKNIKINLLIQNCPTMYISYISLSYKSLTDYNRGGAMVLGVFQFEGALLIWMKL